MNEIKTYGKTPTEWQFIKLKYIFDLYSGGTPLASDNSNYDDDGIPFVNISDMTGNDFIRETKKHLSNKGIQEKNLKILDKGTILYSIYASIGSISQLMIEATISQAILALLPKNQFKFDMDYIKFNLEYLKDHLSYFSNGTTQFNLSADSVKKMLLIVPKYDEQKKISQYLNDKVKNIQDLISIQQQQIEKLNEYKDSLIRKTVLSGLDSSIIKKDSGIDWIGEIPFSWEISKMKNLFYITSGATPRSDNPLFWDGDINWITPADISTDNKYIANGKRSITNSGLNSCSASLLPVGSIVISKRAPIGSTAITTQLLSTNQGCLGCTLKNGKKADYYYYLLISLTKTLEIHGSGTTFLEISANTFANFKIPNPSELEQVLISQYLDYKVDKINYLISNIRYKIELLNEYKKSLIYEYVTGKKQVKQ